METRVHDVVGVEGFGLDMHDDFLRPVSRPVVSRLVFMHAAHEVYLHIYW